MKIIDSHVHFGECDNIADSVKRYDAIIKKYNYDKIVAASLPYCSKHNYQLDESANLCALYLKEALKPKVYAYASIMHYENETKESILEQAKRLVSMGFDGFKSLEGKPNIRKIIGIPLDDEVYDLFFEYLEKNQIPYLIHVGDIDKLFHPETLPQEYIDAGCYYDETHKTNEELWDEAEGILKKFPKLNLIFAHFMFKADDISYCTRLMETYSNMKFDIVPHMDLFTEMSEDIEKWREFFVKYSDRILYGTDLYDSEVSSHTDTMVYTTRRFLEDDGEFHMWDRDIKGLCLDNNVLENIYFKNAEKMLGSVPKPVNREMLAGECEKLKENSNIEYMLNYLKSHK